MSTQHVNGPVVRDRLETHAELFRRARIEDNETEDNNPAQATVKPVAPFQGNTDKRTELERIATTRGGEPRDPDADVPKVEPVPEIPGLFIFTTNVRSRKAGGMVDRVLLNPPSARSLIQHGAFMRTIRRQWSDPITRLLTTEESTTVEFAVLAKHVADMSGLDTAEVEGMNGYDMMRMSLKVQEMMYSLPPK